MLVTGRGKSNKGKLGAYGVFGDDLVQATIHLGCVRWEEREEVGRIAEVRENALNPGVAEE